MPNKSSNFAAIMKKAYIAPYTEVQQYYSEEMMDQSLVIGTSSSAQDLPSPLRRLFLVKTDVGSNI